MIISIINYRLVPSAINWLHICMALVHVGRVLVYFNAHSTVAMWVLSRSQAGRSRNG